SLSFLIIHLFFLCFHFLPFISEFSSILYIIQFPILEILLDSQRMDPASPNTILLCTATGFYPLEIEVQWLKNGQLEEEGVAFGRSDETQPQRGDVYTCQVGHVSLEAPITVQGESHVNMHS
uniref:Ig-like domain-containing protein n=1 Tax=Naja naja TaxID=35670 RepID=A0A8C6VJA2_NAJNA